MRVSLRSSVISRLACVSAAIWMYGAGLAWAGGDGESLTTIQAIIGDAAGTKGFCKLLGMGTNFGTTCPQLPTVTQALLEAAALGLSPPEAVAAQNSIPPGRTVNAGNPAVPLIQGAATPFPLTSTTSPTLSGLLSTLTPLAFQSASKSGSTAVATQLYDPDADTFLYGVTASLFGFTEAPGGTVPDTLLLFYDGLGRTNRNSLRGQTVAKFWLPLTVLNSDGKTERPVVTERAGAPAVPGVTLQLIAPTTDCSASTVTGDFMGSGTPQTIPAAAIGLNCAVVFGPSPTSTQAHAIFEVAIPLLVTGACPTNPSCNSPFFSVSLNTDPAYFYSSLHQNPLTGAALPGPINLGLFTAFTLFDDYALPASATPPLLGANGVAIGLAPSAGPLGSPPTCTPTGCTPPPPTFALCASLPQNGNGQALVPAVGADYAIATDGETLLSAPSSSAPLPDGSPITSVCPTFPPS